jgi:hypothetical protein
MKKYRAVQMITLAAGSVVEFDARQAADRKGRIEPLGDDRYRLMAILQIKAGERFGFDGDLPKAMAEDVEPAGTRDEPVIEADSEAAGSIGKKRSIRRALAVAKDLLG